VVYYKASAWFRKTSINSYCLEHAVLTGSVFNSRQPLRAIVVDSNVFSTRINYATLNSNIILTSSENHSINPVVADLCSHFYHMTRLLIQFKTL